MLYKNLLTGLLISGVFSSCALHNTSTGLTKYQRAMLCYESKSYNEALQLFEEAIPLLRGKQEEASACFYQAYCSFYQKKYEQGSNRFKFFCETFPRDHRSEEAMYMQGHSLYMKSPDVKLDQAFTQEAAHVLYTYLHCYPEGVYVDKASTQLRELDRKLTLKAFNNAKIYHQLTHYRAAVVTLENFQRDFPSSPYNEEAAYLKADAQYCYSKEICKTHKHVERCRAINYSEILLTHRQLDILQGADKRSFDALEEDEEAPQYKYFEEVSEIDEKEQLSIAIRYCQEFMDSYPNSRYSLAVGKIYERLLPMLTSRRKP